MLQKSFSFAVRDSLINVGPLKDFSYGLRINADANATGIAKQSNYELVSKFCVTRFNPGSITFYLDRETGRGVKEVFVAPSCIIVVFHRVCLHYACLSLIPLNDF